jgi:putative transcriptional regulator
MAIQINLDVMLARRKMSLTELSGRVGLSLTSLSLFKTGKNRVYPGLSDPLSCAASK